MKLVPIDRDELHARVQALHRGPFRSALARLLEAEPDLESLVDFSKRHPDRWAQAMAILGRLAGYKDEVHTQQDIQITIATMADADLMDELTRLRAQIDAIDADSTVIPEPDNPATPRIPAPTDITT